MKYILLIILSLSLFSCDSDKAKKNIKDGMVIAATATTMELCQAQDMAAVKKDFNIWISKAMDLDQIERQANSLVAQGENKSNIGSAICRSAMDILVLVYMPNGGQVPLEWKAQVDCMGKLKEKIASKTCDRL